MNRADAEVLSSPAMLRATGVSRRQLDYWERTGTITPSVHHGQGSGSRHVWSLADVDRVRVVAAVMAWADHPSDRARRVAQELPGFELGADFLLVGPNGDRAFADADELGQLCTEFGGSCLVIDLNAVTKESAK